MIRRRRPPPPDTPSPLTQPNPPRSDTPHDESARAHGAKESPSQEPAPTPAPTFCDSVHELLRSLAELEYALLDLQEALLQCDAREWESRRREAGDLLERIRKAAADDHRPGPVE